MKGHLLKTMRNQKSLFSKGDFEFRKSFKIRWMQLSIYLVTCEYNDLLYLE